MYAKVFASLWHGSLVGQSDAQLVFCYLLAHARSDSYVEGHPVEIGALTGIGQERAEAAIAALEAEDPLSRSSELDGKRLERLGPGWAWTIVNHHKYRALRDENDRTIQNREAKRRQRASAKVSQGQPRSSHADADADADADAVKTPLSAEADFLVLWKTYPHYGSRSRKAMALSRWKALKPRPVMAEVISGLGVCKASTDWQKNSGERVPGLQVWIFQRGWDCSDGNGPPREETSMDRMKRRLAEMEATDGNP